MAQSRAGSSVGAVTVGRQWAAIRYFPKGHYRHGEVLLAMGKGKEADAAFARAVDLDPELRRPAATEQNPREVDGSEPIAFAHAIMGLVTKAHGTWPGLSWHEGVPANVQSELS